MAEHGTQAQKQMAEEHVPLVRIGDVAFLLVLVLFGSLFWGATHVPLSDLPSIFAGTYRGME